MSELIEEFQDWTGKWVMLGDFITYPYVSATGGVAMLKGKVVKIHPRHVTVRVIWVSQPWAGRLIGNRRVLRARKNITFLAAHAHYQCCCEC